MQPTYRENDNVIVSSLPLLFTKPKKGDVVVFEKFSKYYVKRIKSIKNGKYFIVGDNKKDSQDSRRFGSVNPSQIKGKVIRKI
jgi:signal peptidase I